MILRPELCLNCERDLWQEVENHFGAIDQMFCPGCGGHFCNVCTNNIYECKHITECPKCGRPVDTRRIKASDINLDDQPESEKTTD